MTGVSFADGALWHGTFEDDTSELRRIDPATGWVIEALEVPGGVSGVEAKGEPLVLRRHQSAGRACREATFREGRREPASSHRRSYESTTRRIGESEAGFDPMQRHWIGGFGLSVTPTAFGAGKPINGAMLSS